MARPAGRKFVGRYTGVGELLRSPAMVAEMLRRAEKAKAYAETIAPHDSGEFASSFEASARADGGYANDRAVGKLTNTDPAALWIELGTRDTPKHATLKRAMLEGMDD